VDPTVGATATATKNGDVLIIGGNSASWASAGPVSGGITGVRDYVAVAVTPNYVGDRSVVAIGASLTPNTGADGATGVVVQVIKTTPAAQAITQTAYLKTSGANTATDFGGAGTSIITGSIALPSDFDATTSSGIRAYVGFAALTTVTDNDVYRVDNDTAKALSAGGGSKRINSVSYAGTIASGTLFQGRYDLSDVQYSTDMTSGSPTWTSTKKFIPGLGTSSTNTTIVKTASDFATSRIVYAGTTGSPSAFSVSTDGGISFNAKSLIDNGVSANTITKINSGPSFSADGKTVYLVDQTTVSSNNISIWKSATPTSDSSWTLIYMASGTSGQLSLSPGFTTDQTIYLYDKVSAGTIWRSNDGGATFSSRTLPAITPGFVVLQDANVGWVASTSGTVYKTTSGGYIWDAATSISNIGTIASFGTGRTDELLVGGTGKIAISKDGGTTYTITDFGTSNAYKITKDTSYATNNLLWIIDATNNTINKFVLGTDTTLTDLSASPAGSAIKGVGIRSGVLYVTYPDRILRTLNPMDTPGNILWDVMTQGLSITIASSTSTKDVDTILYAKSATNGLVAYDDQMATAKPVVISPSDNASLTVNPVTGYGSQFNLVLNGVGTGTGLGTQFQVQLTETAVGFNGATTSGNISVTSAATPQISVGPTGQFVISLEANKAYQYRVRAVKELSGDSVRSLWSDARNITVASGGIVQGTQYGPVLNGPTGNTASTTPGFAWAPVFGANKYRFTLATDAALTKAVAGTPFLTTLPSFQVTTPLTEGVTYFWSVQVIDPTAGPISVGTFTTAPKVTVAPQPTFTVPPQPTPTYTITVPPAPAPTITVTTAPAPPATQITPAFIWAIIIIGAVLVIAVIVLIVRTRKTP
ncbi:MAG: hypothetical protein Q7R57_04415, partial [Dehalococcoidales bacterium]|nr:hypothetical protein [Dehalococcoidales bacterium]